MAGGDGGPNFFSLASAELYTPDVVDLIFADGFD